MAVGNYIIQHTQSINYVVAAVWKINNNLNMLFHVGNQIID